MNVPKGLKRFESFSYRFYRLQIVSIDSMTRHTERHISLFFAPFPPSSLAVVFVIFDTIIIIILERLSTPSELLAPMDSLTK